MICRSETGCTRWICVQEKWSARRMKTEMSSRRPTLVCIYYGSSARLYIYIGYIARRNRGVSILRRVGMHHRRQSRRNTTVPIECMQIIKDIVRRLIKQTRYGLYVSRESIFSFFFFFFSNRQNLLQLDQFYYCDLNSIELDLKKKVVLYDFINFKNNIRIVTIFKS